MTREEEFQQQIESQLGIDLTKYRDEDVANSLLDLLLFPKYIFKWILIPAFLSIVLFILGFFIVDLVHVQYLIYGVVGLILFPIVGVFLGVLYFARQLTEDLGSISEYSFSVLDNSIEDAKGLADQSLEKKEILALLFKGVIFVVTIPMLGSAIDKKMPFGGGIAKRLMNGSLNAIASRLEFSPLSKENTGGLANKSETRDFSLAISQARSQANKILRTGIRIAATPFRLAFYIFLALLTLFIYVIW